MSANIPADLKYAKTHEWLRAAGDTATMGITDHAQHELTDVVFVELPPVGRKVTAGQSCAVVESVKTASDIYAPVSGEVVAANEELAAHPELVNTDPYGKGWLIQIKMAQPTETQALLGPEDYGRQITA